MAGSIELRGLNITIDNGARLLATGSTPLARNGLIALSAVDNRASVQGLGFANIDLIRTSINIGDATIRGRNVDLRATADSQKLLLPSDFAPNPLAQILGATVLSGIVSALEGISAFVGVSVAHSSALINVGTNKTAPAIIEATSFSAQTIAKSYSLAQPISVIFGAGVGVAITKAEANILNATISALQDVVVRASTDHIVDVLADAAGPAAIGVGVSVIVNDSKAIVSKDARITVGQDLFIQAETIDRTRTAAQGTTGNEGLLGITIALGVNVSDVVAQLNGQATVGRNINVVSKQSKLPVPANKAFLFPSFVSGVNAYVNVGTNSTGDLLDNSKAAGTSVIVGLIMDGTYPNGSKAKGGGIRGAINGSKKIKGWNGWFFTKIKAFANPPAEVDRPKARLVPPLQWQSMMLMCLQALATPSLSIRPS